MPRFKSYSRKKHNCALCSVGRIIAVDLDGRPVVEGEDDERDICESIWDYYSRCYTYLTGLCSLDDE